MLGVQSVHNPIQGEFARQLRETMSRMQSGQLNEADIRRQKFQEERGEYDFQWKQGHHL